MPKLLWPVDVERYHISQEFGVCGSQWLCDFYHSVGLIAHNGIDFACPVGTPVYAAHSGRVTHVYTSKYGGKAIKLRDNKLLELHLHLSQQLVSVGDEVKAGDLIAYSGNTGQATTGPHLHFGLYEVDKYGSVQNIDNGYQGAIDPMPYLIDPPAEGTLIKDKDIEPVYIMRNGYRWWIGGVSTKEGEEVFERYMGYPVSQAKIEIVSREILNTVPYGGAISK